MEAVAIAGGLEKNLKLNCRGIAIKGGLGKCLTNTAPYIPGFLIRKRFIRRRGSNGQIRDHEAQFPLVFLLAKA